MSNTVETDNGQVRLLLNQMVLDANSENQDVGMKLENAVNVTKSPICPIENQLRSSNRMKIPRSGPIEEI